MTSPKKTTSKTVPIRRSRRINIKGLAYFGITLAVVGVLYFPLKVMADRRARTSALAQAKESADKGDIDLALRHLNGYLASWPDDIPALEEKAKLLGETARGPSQILDAANINDHLLRLDPSSPGRRETRRKLAELYIRYSDVARNYSLLRPDLAKAAHETRYIAAIRVARQLLENNEKDPAARKKLAQELEKDGGAHRLLAMALDGQLATGDAKGTEIGKQLDEAEKEYREALRIDSRDAVASERLAELYFTRLNEPAEAEATLDEMLKANPDSVPVRMSRYRAFSLAKQPAKARAELDAALVLDPTNSVLRAVAAGEAIGRRDTVEARRHLDAIPAARQDDLRVRFLRGRLENAEQHPDDAIEEWRKGLAAAGGTDLELTWWLARTLIDLGRIGEARPLVAQYQRLDKDDANGQGRYLRAMFEQRSGRPVRAIEDLNRIHDRKETTNKAEIQFLLGRCFEDIGDESRALIAYRRAATLMPQSSIPRRSIARLLQARDLDQAIAELELALTQSPDDLGLVADVTRLRLLRQLNLPAGQRQWRDVVECLDRGEKLAPGHRVFLSLRAEYLANSGRLAEAVELLGNAAQGPDRKRPDAWITWATALLRMNRGEEAIQALEQASKPDASGDRAAFRIARSRLLARSGQGQAARDLLSKDREAVPEAERPELSHELGELLRLLGDRDGARAAFAEWARLAPDNPQPGLMLLGLARVNDDDEAAKIGLETLHRLGGDQEPYGLVAQTFELLRTDRARPGPLSKEKLDDADRLVSRLAAEAPHMLIGHFLKGAILELRSALETSADGQSKRLDEAAIAYRKAMKDDSIALTLPRLVEVLAKLKRFDELDAMKKKFDEQAALGQQPGLAAEFDRISAIAAMKLGDTARAEFYATQIVEGQPDNVQSRASLAQFLDRLGKAKEAEATLQTLVDRKPKEPSSWLALVAFLGPRRPKAEVARAIERARDGYKGERRELLLAQCHWLANDLPNAKLLYKAALAKQPNDPPTLRAVAEFDEAIGQVEELETILRAALKVDPRASWASRALALRISSRSDPSTWAEAWALVAPGAPGTGDTPEERLIRATLLARSPENARRSEAIPAFSALAVDLPASNPVGLEARLRLAQAMLESGRPADAWSYIAPVADDVNRPNPMALSIAVEALVRLGKPDQAERRLDRLAALEPKSPRTAWSRAWVLQSKDKKAEASASVESAFANAGAAPEGESIGLTGVDLLMKFGDLETADRIAKQVASRWPRDSWLVARVQFARKDYDRALASCQAALDAGSSREALRLATSSAIARRSSPEFLKQVEQLGDSARAKSPKDPNILVFLATVFHLQDRYEEEVALYRQALELNPSNVRFLNNMAWTLCEGLHKPEEALTRIDEAIAREGLSPEFLDTRGVIRGRLGRNEESIADLELSVKGDPSPTTYFHLARAYLKAGRAADLRRCRDLALKAKFDSTALDPTDRAEMKEVMGNP